MSGICPRCGQPIVVAWAGVHPGCFLYRARYVVAALAVAVVVPVAKMSWPVISSLGARSAQNAEYEAPPPSAIPPPPVLAPRPTAVMHPSLAVAALGANLRAAPSPESMKLRELKRGDLLRPLERQSGFVHVQGPDGQVGWISDTLVISAASLARLQNTTAVEYAKSRGGGESIVGVARQLAPHYPRLARVREVMPADPAAAEAMLRETVTLVAVSAGSDADAARWYGWAARAAENANDFEAAATLWMAAINADPANPEPHGAYGIVCLRIKRYDHASAAARMLQVLAPASTLTWFLTGTTDALNNRHAQAVTAYAMALRLARNPPATRRSLSEWARIMQDARVSSAVSAALARAG